MPGSSALALANAEAHLTGATECPGFASVASNPAAPAPCLPPWQVIEELFAYWNLEDADETLEELEDALIVSCSRPLAPHAGKPGCQCVGMIDHPGT